MVYTITLNPALDYVMKVGSLSYGDINRSKGEEIYYGGKGINVSVVLTRLGIENKALGFVAGFTGRQLEKMLTDDSIRCDFNKLETGLTRINVKIKADVESGTGKQGSAINELDVNAQGPNISRHDIAELLDKLNEMQEGDFLVLAGSIPNTLPDDIYEVILAKLHSRNVNFVVDATGDLLKNALQYKPFLIKPNHLELGDLFGVETTTEEEIVTYAKKLQEMGARNVLVSRAEEGAILVDENGNITKTFNVEGKMLNSVGCGDSMVAGFLAGYISQKDYAYALKMGTACGNATAFSEELATKEEVQEIFDILQGKQ